MKRLPTLGLVALLAAATGAAAQTAELAHATSPGLYAGERSGYAVTLGPFGTVGEASMEVVGRETIRDRSTYRLRFDLEGGIWFAKVDTRMESWVEPNTFSAMRFFRDQHEVNYKRRQTIDFFPDEMRWRASDGTSGELGSDRPLDDVSFLYYVRQLPLDVGETYVLERYFKPDGNPVTIRVVRKETITVPAGRFETIVIRPEIRTSGLFSEGGEAEVYFTDDDRRILVQLKSKVPIVGSLTLKLKAYTPGERPTSLADRR
ncbi:MAG: DUF3108 domain-containing protein [Longimicrobiales bacterium]